MADAKNVAKKSSSIVDRMTGSSEDVPQAVARGRDRELIARLRRRSIRGRARRASSTRPPTTNRNDTALTAYAQPTLRPRDEQVRPAPAPCTDVVCTIAVFRFTALGRCSRGTSVATIECRAGGSKAPTAAPRPPAHTRARGAGRRQTRGSTTLPATSVPRSA